MKKHWTDKEVFILLIVVAIISRFFTFFNVVLDWDESTYLVIAQQICKGKILYKDFIDLKPPVGLWLFAIMSKVFGTLIPLYRLFLALLIGIMSFLLYKLHINVGGNQKGAVVTGLLFILINLFHSALSFNLEHWMNFFTIIGFYIFFSLNSPWKYFFSGLLIGISFSVKYLSLLDFCALSSLILYFHFYDDKKNGILGLVRKLFTLGLGFSLPFVMVNLYFYLSDNWDSFYFITYVAPGNYSSEANLIKRISSVLNIHINYIIYFVLFYLAFFSKMVGRKIKIIAMVWLCTSIIATQLTGQFFRHYVMQMYAPLCLLSGAFIESKLSFIEKGKDLFYQKKWKVGIIGFICVFTLIFNYFDYYLEKDPMAQVMSYLDENMGEDESFLALNCGAIVYFDRHIEPMHPYVHSSLLFRDVHVRTLNIDVNSVVSKMIEKPRDYILFQENNLRNERMDKFMQENYTLMKGFQRNVNLYKYQAKDPKSKIERR